MPQTMFGLIQQQNKNKKQFYRAFVPEHKPPQEEEKD
jgi:hypothetical protein